MARQAARAVSLTVKMIPSKMIVEKDTFLIDDIFNSHALNATVSCRFIASLTQTSCIAVLAIATVVVVLTVRQKIPRTVMVV